MPKNFTDAEIADIRGLYNGAKNKRKQIDILAQLHTCTKPEVMQVLGLNEPVPAPAPRKQKIIPPEVKQACCDEVLSGKAVALVAAEHGISTPPLYEWLRQRKADPTVFTGTDAAKVAPPAPVTDTEFAKLEAGLEGLKCFVSAFGDVAARNTNFMRELKDISARSTEFVAGVAYALRKEAKKDER